MDHKREHRTPPLARVMGVGRQQQQISTICMDMAQTYDEDISPSGLCQEVQDLKLVKNRVPEAALELLSFIKKYIKGLSNLRVAIRILLYLCVSVASCERSFSKLKLIKTYSISQNRHFLASNVVVVVRLPRPMEGKG